MNLVVLVGNLTKDPETRQTQSGKSVTNFTLAVSRQFQKNETDYLDCVAWGKTAELVSQYLSKGKKCLIQGRVQTETWEAQDGTKRKAVKIICESVQFLSPRGDVAQQTPIESIGEEVSMDDMETIPF